MTLIVAIPCQAAVVFGADSQLTIGHIRQTGTKVQRLNDHAVWAASGEEAVIQRVAERIEAFPQRHQPLLTIRDSLCTMVREAVQQLLALDFRTQFFTGDPKALLDLHPADFLFAEYRDQARILHVLINGTPEWIAGRPGATGNGAVFAHALLTKYGGTQLVCDRAELLCYKVIEEAIQVGAYGLGPPIDIWSIDANGARRAPEDQIAALEDAARLVRQRETELLVAGPGQDAAPTGPDDEAGAPIAPGADGAVAPHPTA